MVRAPSRLDSNAFVEGGLEAIEGVDPQRRERWQLALTTHQRNYILSLLI